MRHGQDYFTKFNEEMADPTSLDDLMSDVPSYDSMSPRMEQSTVWSIGLQSGDESSTVDIEPVLRSWVFKDLDSVRIKDTAYMPALELGNPANLQ